MIQCSRLLIAVSLLFIAIGSLSAEAIVTDEIASLSFNLTMYLDLANLEYDDSPYPGRTNLGHILIPSLITETDYFEIITGGWYQQVYVHYDEDDTPERMYPYIALLLYPWDETVITFGNYENLLPFPNTIYNEFLFFEERPISSGLKIAYPGDNLLFIGYLDWTELDTEEHPEEFLSGICFEHYPFEFFYYKAYIHYHHKGGQLHKETHPVRLEQDIAASPLIGFGYESFFLDFQYYWSIFEQNFKPATYGHAGDISLGYEFTEYLKLSYLCWYNYNYYHGDAHLFYLKRKNVLHRLRIYYTLLSFQNTADINCTVNLYGPDPPGIDFRISGKIDLDLISYENKSGL